MVSSLGFCQLCSLNVGKRDHVFDVRVRMDA